MGETVEQMNRAPEVGLTKQPAVRVPKQGGVITIDAQVKPYSVNLFVVRDKRN